MPFSIPRYDEWKLASPDDEEMTDEEREERIAWEDERADYLYDRYRDEMMERRNDDQ